MGIDQTRRQLNQSNKEIVDLEKKIAEETKKEADKTKKIYDLQSSTNKSTNPATIHARTRQMQTYQNDLVRIANSKAAINRKIFEKRKTISQLQLKLQKEEAEEQLRISKEQLKIQKEHEQEITNLKQQLDDKVAKSINESRHLYQKSNEVYDIFISHASEDKETFVNDLYSALVELGVKVWYDSETLSWGDSLRSQIDQGLRNSKYGIVVISSDYIKKGWTEYELDGLFQYEMNKGKTILPVWHNITKKKVEEFSLPLAGRLALSTAIYTPAEIALKVVELLGIEGN